MKIVYFGNGSRGQVCLEALVDAGHNVSLVVCLPKEEQPSWTTPMQVVAMGLGIPVWDGKVECVAPTIEEMNPDIIILAGYPKMVSADIYEIPKLCINLHAGPLPRYRGPHPLNWQLINGETRGGISIIKVDGGVDTGPILAKKQFKIPLHWDYTDMVKIANEHYPLMLLYVLDGFEKGTMKRIEQNPEEGFWCSRRYPRDGLINWSEMTDVQVYNMVRALVSPMPGAYTMIQSESIFIKESVVTLETVKLLARTYTGVPGRVAATWPSGVVVLCKNRGILIETVIRDGEKVPPKDVFPPTGGDL